MMRWSRSRLLAAAVLGAWAATFWFVGVSGRTGSYLSSRTAWLIPLGAGLATVAAVGRLATARTVDPEPLDDRARWNAAIFVLPVLVLLALPPATLDTFSAGRRSSLGGAGGLITPDDFEHGPLTMIHIAAAETDPGDMARLTARAEETVTLEGFVTRDEGAPADEIALTRFVLSCCVADATTARVRVAGVSPGAYEEGSWVSVTGRVYPLGDRIVVLATSSEQIPEPDEPYLSST
jgi:uncharacterized repeat protein (TIGR03943 family)